MRKLTLLLVLSVFMLLVPTTTLQATFRFTYDTRETTYYNGLRHTELIGTLLYDDSETTQKINYLGGNPTTSENLHVITADNYLSYSWGKGDLATIIASTHLRYDNYHVLGGVNGDFYGANGIPIEAFVRDFEVLSIGLGTQRTVVGFKDDGSVVFGRPCYEGYEAIVFNNNGQIKHRFPIEAINQYPTVPGQVSVFFDDFSPTVSGAYNKVVLGATELKLDEYQRTYFGKGLFDYETTEDVTVDLYHMVLVGTTLNSDSLFDTGDEVVIQQKLGCEFTDVRFAIGAWEKLVEDGVATEVYYEGAGPTYRHPRTAIGVKADGTVFFVTVDGRDYDNGYLGVTAYELAEIMLYFDAIHAYNLDGGGSTAMIVENENAEYVYLNTPSDGQPRAVSNGLFFVSGEHNDLPVTLPYPDDRVTLQSPSNLMVTGSSLLTFDPIEHASSYEVDIDGTIYTTIEPSFQINVTPGLHLIQVKANGDYTDFKDSEFSPQIIYVYYTDEVQSLIDFLKTSAKQK